VFKCGDDAEKTLKHMFCVGIFAQRTIEFVRNVKTVATSNVLGIRYCCVILHFNKYMNVMKVVLP
jgi:hypothetical protein